MSIGSRSQSARTYLEKVLKEIETCDRNQLIKHGLLALRETLPADQVIWYFRYYCNIWTRNSTLWWKQRNMYISVFQELTAQNVTVCVVGKGEKYTEYNDSSVQEYLDLLDSTKKPSLRAAASNEGEEAAVAEDAPAAPEEGQAPMEE